MSIDIRHITNGVESGYYVRNSDITPMTVEFYSKKEDIPESTRHYAPSDEGEPKYWGPDMARIMGCQKLLYPDFPQICGHPEYQGQICVAESCRYAPNSDWTRCPYFKE